jgi:hypothetical protein
VLESVTIYWKLASPRNPVVGVKMKLPSGFNVAIPPTSVPTFVNVSGGTPSLTLFATVSDNGVSAQVNNKMLFAIGLVFGFIVTCPVLVHVFASVT